MCLTALLISPSYPFMLKHNRCSTWHAEAFRDLSHTHFWTRGVRWGPCGHESSWAGLKELELWSGLLSSLRELTGEPYRQALGLSEVSNPSPSPSLASLTHLFSSSQLPSRVRPVTLIFGGWEPCSAIGEGEGMERRSSVFKVKGKISVSGSRAPDRSNSSCPAMESSFLQETFHVPAGLKERAPPTQRRNENRWAGAERDSYFHSKSRADVQRYMPKTFAVKLFSGRFPASTSML